MEIVSTGVSIGWASKGIISWFWVKLIFWTSLFASSKFVEIVSTGVSIGWASKGIISVVVVTGISFIGIVVVGNLIAEEIFSKFKFWFSVPNSKTLVVVVWVIGIGVLIVVSFCGVSILLFWISTEVIFVEIGASNLVICGSFLLFCSISL